VPAYNEEKQIRTVIESMPGFVDRIVVVNDGSTDRTSDIVTELLDSEPGTASEIKCVWQNLKSNSFNHADIVLQQQTKEEHKLLTPALVANKNPDRERVILIRHLKNAGVGAAIANGYKWCKDHGIDCTAVMAGDGQMDPAELESICRPVIDEKIDYVKGNRLIHRSAWLVIPKIRFIGNSILSILTKFASGYWHVSDTQTGFTAISKSALQAICLHKIYKGYGMPNDMLVKLNIAFCSIKEVPIKPIYDIGEKSKMKVLAVIPRIACLLFRSFFKRLWIKYFFRDFNPLFLLYHLSFILGLISLPYAIKIIKGFIIGYTVNYGPILAFVFLFISGIQFLLFAMWMDIQDNERLYR
jgi:glycosyltransferase involved in cell wall biosynthesis